MATKISQWDRTDTRLESTPETKESYRALHSRVVMLKQMSSMQTAWNAYLCEIHERYNENLRFAIRLP